MRLNKTSETDRAGTITGRLLVIGPVLLSMILPSTMFTGCSAPRRQWEKTVYNDTSDIDAITHQIDNPAPDQHHNVSMTSAPVTAVSVNESDIQYVEVTLDETLAQAMEHSTVLRDIGGMVLRSPGTIKTGYATRLQEMDPRFGMESALSAFDAQLNASATFNNNDRIFNNSFLAGGINAYQQDLHEYQMELSKRTATGSLLAVRGVSNFDSNNAPANTFSSYWNTWLEGEVRQPLLQGAGLEFNRIAGPGATAGVYNGVLIAKANSDINHSEFIKSLQDFVSNVENAYWDLYLSYRELDARKKAMERALVEWNNSKNRKAAGTIEIGEEALARQQYYQLKAEVDEALSGRLLQGTQTQNGSSGGTMQTQGGVLTAERRLRLLVGLPAADGRLLRPLDEPTMASIHFDWYSCMNEAIQQRPELQRTHIAVRKREMELLAAQNFLNPRLDAVGRYRWRGFGDDYIAGGNQAGNRPSSAVGNLVTGNQQEWTMGVELTVPIGYRKAHAAVQHAELALARERAIQKEQQREVISNLSGAVADAVRAYQAVENNLNQYLAANDYLKDLETRRNEKIRDGVDRIIDAQRRQLQSEIQFFRARAEYAVALKNVHYEKGSLLRYKDLRVAGDDFNADSWADDQPIAEEVIVNEVIHQDAAIPETSAGADQPAGDAAPSNQQIPADVPPASDNSVPAVPAAPDNAATQPAAPTTPTSTVSTSDVVAEGAGTTTSDSVPVVEDVPPVNLRPQTSAVEESDSDSAVTPIPADFSRSAGAVPDFTDEDFTVWPGPAEKTQSPANSNPEASVSPVFSAESPNAFGTDSTSRSATPRPAPPRNPFASLRGSSIEAVRSAGRADLSRDAQTSTQSSAASESRRSGEIGKGKVHSVSLSASGDESGRSDSEIGAITPLPQTAEAGPMSPLHPPIGAVTPIPGVIDEVGPMTPLK
ncbi:MAG: TolC family protein [Planctomycetaceae bacterium]